MEKKYYVYIFLDQRHTGLWKYKNLKFDFKPFYVGKGKNGRITTHFNNKLLLRNNHKNNIIKQIKSELGELPIHYRVYENLSESEAFEIEKSIIKHFGRHNQNGILVNLTDGGDGHSGYHEPKISRRKKIYQYDLNGKFLKEWEYISMLSEYFKSVGNISTAVKRNGTCYGYIWSYEFKENFDPKIKYQMPIKYTNIKQIDKLTGEVINTFENALLAEKELKLRVGGRTKIYECLQGKLKTAYGYKWEK